MLEEGYTIWGTAVRFPFKITELGTTLNIRGKNGGAFPGVPFRETIRNIQNCQRHGSVSRKHKEDARFMNAQLKEKQAIDRNMAAIYEVRAKRDLLDKCSRKLAMVSLSRDDVRILEAACEQLTEEINTLCWRIGL